MCGIAGYKFFNKDQISFNKNINQTLNTLKNRGPDYQDYWSNSEGNCFLLNTRLKIQDLNDRANMPMRSVCKNYIITYNGELFNKKFLIKKYLTSVKLNTDSDTEVILQLYINYGFKLLDFLDGMYSIAIYNLIDHQLFLARDPLGIKPLYYTTEDNFLFLISLSVKERTLFTDKLSTIETEFPFFFKCNARLWPINPQPPTKSIFLFISPRLNLLLFYKFYQLLSFLA